MIPDSARFIIYDASAGAGKTFTLVRDYIAALLTGKTTYKNMLAITFTNKAVAELKSRIITCLKEISQPVVADAYQSIFNAIKEQTGLDDTQIQSRAGKIIKNILHNYAAFEISTIDSFTHRILQIFARELQLPTHFEVEVNTDEILQEAVDRVIALAGFEKNLTRSLIDFTLFKMDTGRSWDVERDLNDIAKLITNELSFKALEKIKDKTLADFKTFEKDLKKEIERQKETRKETAAAFLALLQTKGVEPGDFTGKYASNHFIKLAEGQWINPATGGWATETETAKLYNEGLPESKKHTIDSLRPALKKAYQKTEEAYYKHEFYDKILKENNALSLLSAIQKEVEQIKEERGLVLISDFNKTIHKNIKDEPVPFIYERLGDRFNTFYIDEFQDTSELQWNNLKPLIAESLSAEKGSLSLVGDAKQSIYRWRGGKAEQFMDLSGSLNPFFVTKKHHRLPDNYRSLQEIVAFNNDFFRFASRYLRAEAYQKLYENVAQNPTRPSGGLVDIRFLPPGNKEEMNEVYPPEVLKIIRELAGQYPADYPFYGDICILVRKKEAGVVIADYLSQYQIPIISSETLLLNKSPKIKFLIALLYFTMRPHDKQLKFEILNYLYKVTPTEESAYRFIHSRLELNSYRFFKSLEPYDYFYQTAGFEQLPLYDAVEYAARQFGLFKSGDAYLQFFLDFVYEYSAKHSGGLIGFLDLWEIKKDKLSIVSPEKGNAIRIMTIHKAKGLEFPVVIYPYAHSNISDSQKDMLWIDLEEKPNLIPVTYLPVNKNMTHYSSHAAATYQQFIQQKEMDAINTLYVALTRPKEKLYILSKLDEVDADKDSPQTLAGWLISYLKEREQWEADKSHYIFGEIRTTDHKDTRSAPAEHDIVLNHFNSSALSTHNLTFITKSGLLWDSDQQKAIERGNLIHDLLKEVHTAADVSAVIDKALLAGDISIRENEHYRAVLDKIINHPELAPYFLPDYLIKTEQEILADKRYLRLDRLCLQGKEAVIIDYKTGAYHQTHETQITEYAAAVEKLGYNVQKALLVYIENQITVRKVKMFLKE